MTASTDTPPQSAGDDRAMNLLYTVAFDAPGEAVMRDMAKMLGASVVRTRCSGGMILFHNAAEPVFKFPREGLQESSVALAAEADAFKRQAREWKPQAAAMIDGAEFGWVMHLDADSLCLRNVDHLLEERQCDILYQPQAGTDMRTAPFNGYLSAEEMNPGRTGIDAGVWAVRGSLYGEVMERWREIQTTAPERETDRLDQSAWNRLVLDAADHGWSAEPFEAHEVQYPFLADKDWRLYRDAAIVHGAGGTVKEKAALLFGLYMQRFFHDAPCDLLNILET